MRVTEQEFNKVRRLAEEFDLDIYDILYQLKATEEDFVDFRDEYEEEYGRNGWDCLVGEKGEEVMDKIEDFVL